MANTDFTDMSPALGSAAQPPSAFGAFGDSPADQARDTQLKTGNVPPSLFGGDIDPKALGELKAKELDLQKQKTGAEALYEKRLADLQARNDADMRKAREQEGQTLNDIKPWNPQTMAPPKHDLWESFGSPGFMLAMLASAFTRMPMNSALQAGGAAINAINQGDMLAYKQAFDAWKDNTELAFKRMDEQHREYDDIAKLAKTDIDLYEARMRAAAARFGDQAIESYMQAGLYQEIDQLLNGRSAALKQASDARIAILENNMIINALNGVPHPDGDHKDAAGNPMMGGIPGWYKMTDPKGAMKEVMDQIALMKLKPEDRIKREDASKAADSYAKQYAENPNSFWALDPAQQQKVRAALAVFHPEIQIPEKPAGGYLKAFGIDDNTANVMADYERLTGKAPNLGWGAQMNEVKLELAKIAAERQRQGTPIDPAATMMAQQQAVYAGTVSGARSVGTYGKRLELAANVATTAIPKALAASDAIPRDKWVPVNKAILAYKQQTSDPDVSRFAVANQQIAELWARAMNPSGQLHNYFVQLALDKLSLAKDQTAYRATLKEIWENIQAEKRGVTQTYGEEAGAPADTTNPFSNAVPVETPEEAEKLAPGTHFVTPDGEEYVR